MGRRVRFLFVLLGLLVCCPALWAGQGYSREYLREWDAILKASREYGLNPLLVWAVISVESGFSSPYVIGVDVNDGNLKALKRAAREARFVAKRVSRFRLAVFPESEADGVRVVRELEASGVSFDVGLGQINSGTARSFGVDPAALLDASYNVAFTAFYLRRVIDLHGPDSLWKYNGRPSYQKRLLARLRTVGRYYAEAEEK